MKQRISFLFKGEQLKYSLIVLIMCLLYIIYPVFLQAYVCDRLDAKIGSVRVFNLTLDLVPLIWILLVGLFVSLANTLIYCFFVTKGEAGNGWRVIFDVVLFFLVGALSYWLYDKFDHFGEFDPSEIMAIFHKFSLYVTVLTCSIFAFFSTIDICDIRSIRKKMDKSDGIERSRLYNNLEYSWLQLLLIDGTVLLCSGALSLYSSLLDNNRMYPDIFMTGAWGFQIIYSQFVFYILTIRYYYNKMRTS